MSFSHDVRNELARIIPEKACCRKAELVALLILQAEINESEEGMPLLVTTVENAALARKIYTLLKGVYGLASTVRVQKIKRFRKSRAYMVETKLDNPGGNKLRQDLGISASGIKRQVDWSLIGKKCCKRAYLRGIFTCRGFVNRPESEYHLEIVLNDSRLVNEIGKIMRRLDIEARSSERKNSLLLYIKDSEKIVDFLRIVEASRALLEFENVRIVKSMRNQVNRQVNCETANLAKTVDASVRQLEAIRKLIDQRGITGLPVNLRELALLRIDHPDSTFKELGMMLEPPLTKSGVAYRMKRLESLAEEVGDI